MSLWEVLKNNMFVFAVAAVQTIADVPPTSVYFCPDMCHEVIENGNGSNSSGGFSFNFN